MLRVVLSIAHASYRLWFARAVPTAKTIGAQIAWTHCDRANTRANSVGDRMLYQAYQAHADMVWPARVFARVVAPALADGRFWLSERLTVRRLAAAYEVFALAGLSHRRPAFGIATVKVDGREVPVRERVAHSAPFGTLLHFQKDVRT